MTLHHTILRLDWMQVAYFIEEVLNCAMFMFFFTVV